MTNETVPSTLSAPEAERAIIVSLLLAPDRMVEAQARLQPDDFTLSPLRWIFSALLDLYRAATPYTIIALVEHLKAKGMYTAIGGTATLAGLADHCGMIEIAHFKHNARILSDTGNLRRMAAKFRSLAADAETTRAADHNDVCTYFADAQNQVRELADKATASMEARTSADILDAARIRAGQPADDRPTIKMGLLDIDGMGQILRRGRLIVVGARPGVGKSTMLLHIALEAARQGESATLVSMEMPEEELAERITAHELGQAMPPTGFAPDSYGYVGGDAIHKLLHIHATPRVSIGALREHARDAHRRGNCGILLVDYLQLLRAAKCDNRQQEVSAVARGLKDIAMELDIPIVAAAQLNRTVIGRDEPGLENLRESGDIEAAADVAILLWRKDDKDGRLQVRVAKFRGGNPGRCELDYSPATYTLRNVQLMGEDLMAAEKAWSLR